MVRGENGNPGHFEFFYGEAEDAVAAGRYLATLPRVDPKRIYITGHSAGGTLALLAAMLPSPYALAAPGDGRPRPGDKDDNLAENRRLQALATHFKRRCVTELVPGDHFTSKPEAIKRCVKLFKTASRE